MDLIKSLQESFWFGCFTCQLHAIKNQQKWKCYEHVESHVKRIYVHPDGPNKDEITYFKIISSSEHMERFCYVQLKVDSTFEFRIPLKIDRIRQSNFDTNY